MVIIPRYRIKRNGKNEFLVINTDSGKGEQLCPCCGGRLRYRDRVKRIYRVLGGATYRFIIRRLKCISCGKLHRELPSFLIPHKHYGAELIEDVIDGTVGEEDIAAMDYPCESTVKYWISWYLYNKEDINGQIRSTIYTIMDFKAELLKSTHSLLEGLRQRFSPGWLPVVVRLIYNSGERIRPLLGGSPPRAPVPGYGNAPTFVC